MRNDPFQIPVTGFTAGSILRLTASEDPDTLETIVRSDPALAFQVLHITNSPFCGLRGKVSSLSHAAALLGREALHTLALGALRRLGPESDGSLVREEDPTQFFARSLHVAHTARTLAEHAGYDLPEEAYVTGLLHDAGAWLPTAAQSPRPGTRRASAARAGSVARKSHFPRALATAISRHRDSDARIASLTPSTRALTHLTAAAEYLVRVLRGDDTDTHGAASLATFELSEATIKTLLERSEASVLRALRVTGIAAETLDQVYEASSTSEALRLAPGLLEDDTTLQNPLAFLSRATRALRQKGSWIEVIEAVVTMMQDDLGFDRVMYLERNRSSRTLTIARAKDGTNLTPPIDGAKLSFGKNEKSLANIIKQREGAILRDAREDAEVLGYFGVSEMAIVPVVVKKQTIGVIAADRFIHRARIAESDLDTLQLLAEKVGLVLENLNLENQGERLKKIAEQDPLTGINNRRYCIDLCRKEIDRARRYSAPLSVVLIDIDNFKDINDNYGHAAGDRVLRELARLVESNSRSTDVIGRFGGDEFLVILPQISREQAITYAERVRMRAVELGHTIHKLYPRCKLAISLGVATWTKGSRIDDVIAAADKALYAAKDRGRNRVCTTE